jgi:S-(hydroxymethyl)glutathione dehydrogenase/alcohol dehydrogenase
VQAAVLEAYGQQLGLAEVDIGAVAPDEVLVRTCASGICHTDRTMQHGARPFPLPLILGHESSGVIEATGSAVTSLRPGDHVVTCAAAFCGRCSWCQRGLPQHCRDNGQARPAAEPPRLTRRGDPVHVLVGLGGFATHMLVSERAVAKIPPQMPLERAALLGCAVLTGVGAVRHRARVAPGETVAVIGCGGVGLNAVQGARLAGAARVIAVDVLDAKLELAAVFGATDLVNAAREDPVAAVTALTDGGADHALEVVGRTGAIEQAFAMTGIRGTVTVVGVARPGELIRIAADDLLMGERRLQGSKLGSGRFRLDIPLYCQLYLDGRLLLDELVTETIGLPEVNRGLAALDAPDGARTMVVFG